MEAFKITVELRSPVILGRGTYWTLDGVCFGIIDDLKSKGLTSMDPQADIPIKQEQGLYFASRALFSNAIVQDDVKIGGIRPVRDMMDAPDFMQSTKKGDQFGMSKVITHRGDYKNHMSRYLKISAPSVSWYAVGNPDKIAKLIEFAGAIGAKRSDGYGLVGEIEYEVGDEFDPIMMDGKLMRPVPQGHAIAKGFSEGMPLSQDTWKPPYYDGTSRDVCFIPRD